MPTYRYVAVGPDGTEIKDRLEAPSEDALRNQLLMRNLEVRQVKQKKSFNELELSPQRVPRAEIMHFSRQMAAFVRRRLRTSTVTGLGLSPARTSDQRTAMPPGVIWVRHSWRTRSLGSRGTPCFRSQPGDATSTRTIANTGRATNEVLSGGGEPARIATSTPSPTRSTR